MMGGYTLVKNDGGGCDGKWRVTMSVGGDSDDGGVGAIILTVVVVECENSCVSILSFALVGRLHYVVRGSWALSMAQGICCGQGLFFMLAGHSPKTRAKIRMTIPITKAVTSASSPVLHSKAKHKVRHEY
jgi:hypothetical protein